MQKISLYHLFILSSGPVTRLAAHIFTMPTQKVYSQLLILVNLYQHVKNQAISSIRFRETIDL